MAAHRFLELLGITDPIVQAPISGFYDAGARRGGCNAGGLGPEQARAAALMCELPAGELVDRLVTETQSVLVRST